MLTEEKIREELKQVIVPGVKRSVWDMNLIREVSVSEEEIRINLASTGLVAAAQNWVETKARHVLEQIPGVKKVQVTYSEAKPESLNKISHIIAVMSGKGGVGKSVVSSLIAVALRRLGYEVGILDADITGPSIPRMFGIAEQPHFTEDALLPVPARSGIEIMSINLLLPNEEEAVIWRGPLIGNTIKQFGTEVLWGRLDYLIIDLPPGTADAPLTVMQSFPISGVIIVFTPQDLVEMIVKKAINMARKMEKPILGVVENMSYLYLQDLDRKIEIFGESKAEEMAKIAGAPLIARIPIDPELVKICDKGEIERYASNVVTELGESLVRVAAVSK